jgi:hypothetical protein
MKTAAISLAIVAGLTGCASITGDTSQYVRVETLDDKGASIKGAKCTLQNDYGSTGGESGGSIIARRSNKDLFIDCKKEGYADASATATSRANAGMWGNIIIGGGIGALIDHNKGTAYTYPEWMKLVFGKVISFDRSDDKDGQPSLAKAPPTAPTAPKNAEVSPASTEVAAAK